MGKMGHSAGRERKPTNKKKQVGKNDEKYLLKQNGRGVQFLGFISVTVITWHRLLF